MKTYFIRFNIAEKISTRENTIINHFLLWWCIRFLLYNIMWKVQLGNGKHLKYIVIRENIKSVEKNHYSYQCLFSILILHATTFSSIHTQFFNIKMSRYLILTSISTVVEYQLVLFFLISSKTDLYALR
jgi:hypothetical protein